MRGACGCPNQGRARSKRLGALIRPPQSDAARRGDALAEQGYSRTPTGRQLVRPARAGRHAAGVITKLTRLPHRGHPFNDQVVKGKVMIQSGAIPVGEQPGGVGQSSKRKYDRWGTVRARKGHQRASEVGALRRQP